MERSRVGTDSIEQEKEMALLKDQWARASGKKKFHSKKPGDKPVGFASSKVSKTRYFDKPQVNKAQPKNSVNKRPQGIKKKKSE